MKTRLVDIEKDYEVISQWWNDRGMNAPSKDSYSTVGFIVDDICAGWLYCTDSKYCFIENGISNPESDKEARDIAADMVLLALINQAQDLGFKTMLTYSNHPALIKRETEKFDFKMSDLKMLYRSL